MSLKDRSGKYDNVHGRQTMQPKTNLFDINVVRGGIPRDSARGGVLKETGPTLTESRGGVLAPWPSYGDDKPVEPQTPHCTAITKKGNPCKAAPIQGTFLCVGHKRSESIDDQE